MRTTLREQRARSILKAWAIDKPTVEDWTEALQIADNTARRDIVRARDHIGAFGLAKQDKLPYKPVLAVGPPSGEPAAQDDLLEWLLRQPNALRAKT